MGKHILVNIYFVLLNYNTTVALDSPLMNKQRKALTQLAVMFCEASRYGPIYDLVLEAMGKDESVLMDEGVWVWIKNWSTISEFALHCKGVESDDNGAVLDPGLVAVVAVYLIENGDEVANLLRLILR